MKQHERAEIIEELICKEFESLSSHLPYTYLKSSEGKKFHIKCVREYIEQITRLSKLF